VKKDGRKLNKNAFEYAGHATSKFIQHIFEQAGNKQIEIGKSE